jgi:hypothetical protein
MNTHKLKMAAGMLGIMLVIALIFILSLAGGCGLYILISSFAGIDSMSELFEHTLNHPGGTTFSILFLALSVFLFICLLFYYIDYYTGHKETKEGNNNMT